MLYDNNGTLYGIIFLPKTYNLNKMMSETLGWYLRSMEYNVSNQYFSKLDKVIENKEVEKNENKKIEKNEDIKETKMYRGIQNEILN